MATLNKNIARDVGGPAPPQTTARPVNALGRSFRSPGSASPAEPYPLFQRGDLPAGNKRLVGEASFDSSTHSRDAADMGKEQQGTPLISSHEKCGCRGGGGLISFERDALPVRGRSHFIGSATAGMRGRDGIDVMARSHSRSPTPEGTDSDRGKGHVSAAEGRWAAEDRQIKTEAHLPSIDVANRAFEVQGSHERWIAAPALSLGWDGTTGAAPTPETEELGAFLAHRRTERREGSGSPGRSPRTGSERPTSLPSLPSSSQEPLTPPPQPACSPSEEDGGHVHCGRIVPRCCDETVEPVKAAVVSLEREGGRVGLGPGMPSFSTSSSAKGVKGDRDKGYASVVGAIGGAKGGEDGSVALGVPLRAKLDAVDGTVAARPDVGCPHFGELADILPLTGKESVGGGVSAGRVDGGRGCGGGGDNFTLAQAMAGPVSVYSQALHVALAFVVLMLVAFAKSENGAVMSSSANEGARAYGRLSARRSVGGGGKKQRRRSGKGVGISLVQRSPVLRRLRAIWSKLWHRVEDNLATRWRAAGHALASLRKAWAALWVPRPHAEADVLAEALASSSRCSEDEERRLRRATGVGAGSSGIGSTRRSSDGSGSDGSKRRGRRDSKVNRRSSRSRPRGGAGEVASDGGGYLRRPMGLNCVSFLSLWGYRHTTGSGGGGGSRSPKFLLVLDLDETLVHCSPCLLEPRRRSLMPDLKLEMRGGAPSDRPACMYAWKRPHLDVFLGVVSRWYEVALFTSARQCFAEPLVDLIDSQCVIRKRFYRDSCVRRNDGSRAADTGSTVASTAREAAGLLPRRRPVGARGGAGLASGAAAGAAAPGPGSSPDNLKDLQVVGSKHFPLRTVIVDNQPRAVVQQANVLPVKSWFPHDTEDRQLLDLLPVLLALTSCHDVRSILGRRQGTGVSTAVGALARSTTAA